MKTIKNDTRYIIKKVLICVLTAVILFNLRKCNAYALESEYFIKVHYNSQYTPSISTTAPTDNTYSFVNSYTSQGVKFNFYFKINASNEVPFENVLFYIFEYNNEYYFYADFYSKYNSNYVDSPISYYKVRPTQSSLYFPPNISAYGENDRLLYNFATLNYNDNLSARGPYGYATKDDFFKVDFNNLTLTHCYQNKTLNYDVLTNGNIVYTNSTAPLHVNDTIKNIPEEDPLQDYTRLDLSGYQAVLLTPKSYEDMLTLSSHTEQPVPGTFNTFLDLTYYSQYCVRGTLINIENVKDILTNTVGVGTGSLSESITGTCYEEPTITTLSYQYDIYTGFIPRGLLIYNNSIIYSNDNAGWVDNQDNPYGLSYIWYNADLYNYYLIEDYNTFSADINYTDYNGDSKTTVIDSIPTFEESMQNALDNYDTNNSVDLTTNKLTSIFNFIKLPFTFFSKLNTESCSSISFPFPHSNENIEIQCLSSSVYDTYLPFSLKNILVIIINGLLFYRCTLSNIDIITDLLDPDDNKLEAVQL